MQVQPDYSYLQPINSMQTIQSNKKLSKQIRQSNKNNKDVRHICRNKQFYIDPIVYLMDEMIKRGVGRARLDDHARALVIEKIPHFVENATSPIYLRAFAIYHFKDHPKLLNIMKIFEKSLETDQFKKDMQVAKESYATYHKEKGSFGVVEKSLGIPLTIFAQAAQLKVYTFSEESSLENGAIK